MEWCLWLCVLCERYHNGWNRNIKRFSACWIVLLTVNPRYFTSSQQVTWPTVYFSVCVCGSWWLLLLHDKVYNVSLFRGTNGNLLAFGRTSTPFIILSVRCDWQYACAVSAARKNNWNWLLTVASLAAGSANEAWWCLVPSAFGRNLTSVIVNVFLYLIYFKKTFYKCRTFSAVWGDNAAISRIIFLTQKDAFLQTLTGYTTLLVSW